MALATKKNKDTQKIEPVGARLVRAREHERVYDEGSVKLTEVPAGG